MASQRPRTTGRTLSIIILAVVVLAAIVVFVYGSGPSPTVGPTATPTASALGQLPASGRVIGVRVAPPSWKTVRSVDVPFSVGYPPNWHVEHMTAGSAPAVTLVDGQGRTLTISGRLFPSSAEAQRALTPLAFTPVPKTVNPPIFIRSYQHTPHHDQVTTVVAFQQGGYLWMARLIQANDLRSFLDGMHTLQGMLATFHAR